MSRFLKKASHSILFRTNCDVCHAAQVKNDVKDAIDLRALRAASKMIVALSLSLFLSPSLFLPFSRSFYFTLLLSISNTLSFSFNFFYQVPNSELP